MSKNIVGTGKSAAKKAPTVVTLPFTFGKLLAIAPMLIVGLFVCGIYLSGIIQLMLGVRELKEDGHEAKAIEYFNWALSGNPFLSEAYEQRANTRLKLEKEKGQSADYSAARRDIAEAIKLNPKKLEYYRVSQDIEHNACDYGKELDVCNQLLAVTPDWNHERVLTNRADLQYLVGDFKNERADRESVIKLDTAALQGHSEYHVYDSCRGAQYRYLGQVDNAIHDYENCAKTADHYDLISLAYLYEHAGRHSKAIDTYSKVIELDKKDPDNKHYEPKDYTYGDIARFRRANLYFKLGQYEKALADSNYLRKKDSEGTSTRLRQVFHTKVLEAMGRKAEAAATRLANLKAFSSDISSNQADPESKAGAYSSRGDYYEAAGEWKKALADYSIALSASSEPLSVHYTDCGRMYTKLGDYDKAIAYFSKGLLPKSDRYDAERVYQGLAEAHLLQNKPQLALEDCNKALAQEGHTDGEGSILRAKIYRQLGKNDLAKIDENEALGMEFSPLPDIY